MNKKAYEFITYCSESVLPSFMVSISTTSMVAKGTKWMISILDIRFLKVSSVKAESTS